MNETKMSGQLYVVATPIGNPGDITLRAIQTLEAADAILCEERKIGSRLLKQLNLTKPLIELNEHNEASLIQDVLVELMNGKNLALISDCGTPVFSDPGRQLIQLLREMNIPIVPIPGVSSLMTALSVCPFNLEQYLFIGFLPPKTDQRQHILERLSQSEYPIILMDTPYRLGKLLQEVAQNFGKKQLIFLACDLTLPEEKILQGAVQDILATIQNRKAEFILIIDKPQRKRVFS
ncbi:MAG: 16S rRNA (cytidine(1402)-2'-O)-methyltransferase [Anaerolineaceae bacterium]